MQSGPRAIFTTEKDAVRLAAHQTELEKHGIDVICQPVEMAFLRGEKVLRKLISSKIERNIS
jgi:tetraacyldisaccharide-1-P 4'-kinase